MDTLERIRQLLAQDIERLTARMAAELTTSNPLLQSIVTNNLKTKGKMIRPMIVILSARMLGSVSNAAIEAAASVELLHNASLVHDDVVDAADTRRGRPTVNSVWDNHVAVLVGDFFVSTSLQLAINTANLDIIGEICRLGKNLSLGELDQIYTAYSHAGNEEAYMRIIAHKTASLFEACARMGAYANGVRDERTEALAKYANLLGMCFQIRDDIFDYYAETAEVGKPTGNDLREGKVTLPLLHVLLDETLPQHEAMVELSRRDSLTDGDIETLMAFARDNGGIEYARGCMARMRNEAAQALAVFPPSDEKQLMLQLFDYVIDRNK